MRNFVFIITIVVLFSCNKKETFLQTEEIIDTSPYAKLTKGSQIPVFGFYGIPYENMTVRRFQQMKEAGIHLSFSYLANIEQMKKALDMADTAGVKLLIQCAEMLTNPALVAETFKDHPANGGYFIRDEPSTNWFPELGLLIKQLKKIDSAHFSYINLYPNYMGLDNIVASSYENYVESYLDIVDPEILSFDHYPVMEHKTNLRPEFYDNLEIISRLAHKKNIDFWAFCLTTPHIGYREPTLSHLRIQAYSNFAYGAKGLQYFTYWTPEVSGYDFHNGPVLTNGTLTNVYYLVQRFNKELQTFSDVFLTTKLKEVFHTGSVVPAGTKKLTVLPPYLKKLSTSGSGAVVSQLENDTDDFLMVVNRDFTNKMGISIQFSDTLANRIMKDGAIVPINRFKYTNFYVEPGDALIYKIPKR